MSSVYLPKLKIRAWRAFLVGVVVILVYVAVLVAGFVRLQVLDEKLGKRFLQTHYVSDVLAAHRGSIFGRDGEDARAPLAMNSDLYDVTVLPRVLADENGSEEQYQRQARDLARVLDMPVEEVERKLRADRGFLYLKKRVPAWVAEHVQALYIPGVGIDYKSERFYPDVLHFAHVLGYTDWQGIGRAGIEYVDHKRLDPTDGEIRYIRAGGKGVVSELLHQPAVPGNNVYLTLDRRVQFASFAALSVAVQRHAAKSAAAIVMDARNGDILALANYPSFNPHYIRPGDEDNQINHALADQVEPGSTVKPFVAALALEQGLTTPDEVFETRRGMQIGRLRVSDSHVREDLDVVGIIRKSSNVGVVELAHRAGAAELEQFYRALGFGGGKVLQFREEASGRLLPHEQWRASDFAVHSYGYGFSLSLPQLIRAYSVFTTGGWLLAPRLWRDAPVEAKRRVLSEETARSVSAMLEEVVSKEGTAPAAAVSGYRVAGKTGTVGKWTNGKFDLSRRRVFFVGYAPASAPRYLIAVMVDEPQQGGDTGGAVAAPVFAEIMRDALMFGGVRPDALAGDAI